MLNNNQQKAVDSNSHRILCLAGAGTGKTKTLVSRVDRLLNSGVLAENILCLTFTRLAGLEMKTRLGEKGKDVFINTFHSFCLKIIKDNLNLFGLSEDFDIISQEERSVLIKQAIKELNLEKEKIKETDIINVINSIEEVDDLNVKLKRARLVAKTYKYMLRSNNSIDLDLIIIETIIKLKENEELRLQYHNQYKYIFVDEFQDTDDYQTYFLNLINPENLFVVGDDYQAIYGFRGTKVQYIIDLSQNKEYEQIKLVDNYRSTDKIVEAANNLISYNVVKTEKDLIAQKDGEEVSFFECNFYENEIEEIVKIINKSNKPLQDYCIITRTNSQIAKAIPILKKNKIPVQLLGAKITSLESKETLDLIDLIKLSKFTDKDILLSYFLKKEIPENKMEEYKIQALKENKSLFEIIKDKEFDIVECIKEIQIKNLYSYSLVDCLNGLKKINYINKIFSMENLLKLINFAINWEKVMKRNNQGYLFEDFLSWFQTKDNSDIQEVINEMQGEGIKISTAHSSKGLEFPIVFLVGMNEGLFPHKRDELEESRRLCYVAITRAKEKLYVSWSKKEIESWSKKEKNTQPSRFIKEMKSHNV